MTNYTTEIAHITAQGDEAESLALWILRQLPEGHEIFVHLRPGSGARDYLEAYTALTRLGTPTIQVLRVVEHPRYNRTTGEYAIGGGGFNKADELVSDFERLAGRGDGTRVSCFAVRSL